jgi:Tfp pilus assembly protein PilN
MRAVNLIPADQRSGQPVGAGRSQGAAYAVLVLIAGLAVMVYAYGGAKHQIASRRAQAASLAAEAQRAQAAAERLAPYTSFIALREQRTQAVKTLMDSRFDWAHVLHEFGRVLPTQTSIASLSGTIGASAVGSSGSSGSASSSSASSGSASSGSAGSSSAGGAPVASSTPPGSVPTFTLSGCAASQTDVALALQRLRLIDGVKEVTLQSSAASASGGGGATGGCPAHAPTFSATVVFDALPASSGAASATTTVSDSSGASTASTTSGVSAR